MRDQHDRGVERDERLLEPLERLDVEVVGRLVEQQQVGCRRSARASDARVSSPPEKLAEAALELVVVEAEAARHHGRAIAPEVAAGVLEARPAARA